jgi:hypothetical protein
VTTGAASRLLVTFLTTSLETQTRDSSLLRWEDRGWRAPLQVPPHEGFFLIAPTQNLWLGDFKPLARLFSKNKLSCLLPSMRKGGQEEAQKERDSCPRSACSSVNFSTDLVLVLDARIQVRFLSCRWSRSVSVVCLFCWGGFFREGGRFLRPPFLHTYICGEVEVACAAVLSSWSSTSTLHSQTFLQQTQKQITLSHTPPRGGSGTSQSPGAHPGPATGSTAQRRSRAKRAGRRPESQRLPPPPQKSHPRQSRHLA